MKYGDSVIYIKDGKPLNGIVLTANGDLLSILYADLQSESLAFQGNLARIAQVARSVRPIGPGMAFGWGVMPLGLGYRMAQAMAIIEKAAPEQLDEVQGLVPAGNPESPHAIGGTIGTPNPDGGTFGVGTSTPNPSEAAPTTEVGEPQTTTSETTQASSETHSEN